MIIVGACMLVAPNAQFMDDMQSFKLECLGESVFECLNGECIFQDRFCDGNYDCEDGSDENFCPHQIPDAQYCNTSHQYLCADGKKCIPNTWVCNLDPDCDDGSDEANCSATLSNANATCKGFQCDGTRCISKFWMCDGAYDCQDKSDEDIEHTCRHALRAREMNNGLRCNIDSFGVTAMLEYTCLDNSFCVPKDMMCDGLNDCKDGSDEGKFCEHWHTMCTNYTCNGTQCVPDRSGPYCDCMSPHSQYNYTSQRCETINNCLDDRPSCSHLCERHGETFKCLCEKGYVTDTASYLCYAPGPEAMLLFSTRNDIRYIKVKTKQQKVVVSGIKRAHGVTFDGTYVYWVETAQGHQAIVRAHIDNVKDTKEVLVAIGLEDPGDIAIDWIGGNIYFTDTERGIISACRVDGSICTVLHADTKRPKFVTLDPKTGKMFWADWHDRPLIMMSRMDGSHPEILVEKLADFATGLALDPPNERLYFVDGTIKVVKLFDFKVYSLFEEAFHHPYAIAVFENTVFWSDWTSDTIQTTDKMHSADKRDLLVTLDESVFDMHIYHPLMMTKDKHPCKSNPCSHLCLVTSNTTYSCACPEGMAVNGTVCKPIQEFRPQYLVLGGGSAFTRIQYSSLGNPEIHGTHFDIGRVQAMAYDNNRDTLYVYDGQRKSICYINMSDFTLGVTHLLAYNGLENVVDMDYDYVSDSLYILDEGRRMIEVISLRTKHKALIYRFAEEEIPISFCVVPEYGRLLVAVSERDYNNEIHIDSIGLDGSDKRHLLMNNILGPNVRLRYSSEMDIVYIADEGHAVIDFIHPEGTGRENFREIITTVASLAVSDTHVFWTDRHTQRLYWADVHKTGQIIRRMEL
ncbi:low-density lipoprotein receptor 1-like [Leptidea sinapis]|uniref:low-density lipoprotein receptor 1-like n=1 Tax=Leptidea sinapis TaxID=189913 RepID=UPI0021C34446|nr:low-density lipoprotein receptor 1-like [Leptidea sinapis]